MALMFPHACYSTHALPFAFAVWAAIAMGLATTALEEAALVDAASHATWSSDLAHATHVTRLRRWRFSNASHAHANQVAMPSNAFWVSPLSTQLRITWLMLRAVHLVFALAHLCI